MKTQQKSTKKPRKQTKKEKFVEEYINTLGNISEACKRTGIHRTTYYLWLKDEDFKNMMSDATEHHNDIVHQRILKKALEEDNDMLKFWAKNQMKHRGFVEQQDINLTHKPAYEKLAETFEEAEQEPDDTGTNQKEEDQNNS